jgi:hypothetical protein
MAGSYLKFIYIGFYCILAPFKAKQNFVKTYITDKLIFLKYLSISSWTKKLRNFPAEMLIHKIWSCPRFRLLVRFRVVLHLELVGRRLGLGIGPLGSERIVELEFIFSAARSLQLQEENLQ